MSEASSNNSTKPVSAAEAMHRAKETISSLPSDNCWKHVQPLCLYQGFWCYPSLLENTILAQQYFKAKSSDIFVCSPPKHGTTWIKSLTIAIVTRTHFDTTSPLLSKSSHEIVPQLELWNFAEGEDALPREVPIIPTHIPYGSLPLSVRDSDCKIVYVCRNPKDAFISEYHFGASLRSKDGSEPDENNNDDDSISLEEAFDLFCQGKSLFGPCLDHVLGFWKASLERPEKVLFLKYEDLKKDTKFYVRKLAEFMGYPFSLEEEQEGGVEKIVDLCSFENLSNLEVNKSGTFLYPNMLRFPNKTFFRKGKVGDWRNHLTPEMAECMDKIIEEKLKDSGLSFSAQ